MNLTRGTDAKFVFRDPPARVGDLFFFTDKFAYPTAIGFAAASIATLARENHMGWYREQ